MILGYELVDVLSEKEKGRVELYQDTENGEYIVVRTLNYRNDTYARLMNIKHENLPKIYNVELYDDCTIVYEEYIKGINIDEAELNEAGVLRTMTELCVVVEYLHIHGILHRDIKPSNILYAADKHIRLIDFEASRKMKKEQENDTMLMGTRGYAPPEQFGFSQTCEQTDIYAIGMTLKHLLGDKANEKGYRKIIKKCTMFEPKKRYKNALRLMWALTYMDCKDTLIRFRNFILRVIIIIALLYVCSRIR